MWNAKNSFKVLCLVSLASIIKIKADSSECEKKEKTLAVLDFAKESISKAKDLQPACGNYSKGIFSNSSECGAKEKVSAYLDIARNLIDIAKANYSAFDVSSNITKEVKKCPFTLLFEKPMDCSEILRNGLTSSGVYTIWPRNRILNGRELEVFCDMDTDGGGWTVIQRRGNFSNKVDFYRNWADYKQGFGYKSEEFWIGNDNIFALTNQRNYVVRFDMKNAAKEHRFARYSSFWIDDENNGYMLHVGSYSGTAEDGISQSNNVQFSTKDKKKGTGNLDCPKKCKGGWWYRNCGYSNLNGINRPGVGNSIDEENMYWHKWMKFNSLLMSEIKIRPEN